MSVKLGFNSFFRNQIKNVSIRGLVSKETVVLRRLGSGNKCSVLSSKLIR